MAISKIITYDLKKPGRNYDDLYKAIKSYGIYTKIAESAWFISTSDSCAIVRDRLAATVDGNDLIFVAELTGVAAWRNIPHDNSEYLKQHL